MTTWPPAAMATLDIESTGVNVETARTVEICLSLIVPGRPTDVRHAIVNPGVEIPQEAIDVHGITNELARAKGRAPAEALDLFLGDVALAIRSGMPLVIMNAPYDLTVLDRDARRHDVPTLSDRLDGEIAPVLDPLVLDKRCIKYRRRVSDTQGARQLKTLCQVYGVPWDDEQAHGAAYDALQAARVVWRIGQWSQKSAEELAAMWVGPFDPPKPMHRNDVQAFRSLGRLDLAGVHAEQVAWYRAQTEDFAQWLRRAANELEHQADSADDEEQREILRREHAETLARIDGLRFDWPMVPYAAREAVPA